MHVGFIFDYNFGPCEHPICIAEKPGELLMSSTTGMYQWYPIEDLTQLGIADVRTVRNLIEQYNARFDVEPLLQFMERKFQKHNVGEFGEAQRYANWLLDQADQNHADPDAAPQVVARQFNRLCESMAVALADSVLAWTAVAETQPSRMNIRAKELAMQQLASFIGEER